MTRANITVTTVGSNYNIVVKIVDLPTTVLGTITYQRPTTEDLAVSLRFAYQRLAAIVIGGVRYAADQSITVDATYGLGFYVTPLHYVDELNNVIGTTKLSDITTGTVLAAALTSSEFAGSPTLPETPYALIGQNTTVTPAVYVAAVWNGTAWVYATKPMGGVWASASALPMSVTTNLTQYRWVNPEL